MLLHVIGHEARLLRRLSRRSIRLMSVLALCRSLGESQLAAAAEPPQEVNLLSWGEGALVVPPAPAESKQGQWSADVLLDEVPESGWANPRGDMTPKSLVFELSAPARITHFVFDTARAFNGARAAKDVKVEISDHATSGYSK